MPDSTFLLIFVFSVDLVLSIALAMLDAGLLSRDVLLLTLDIALFLAFHYAVLTFFKLERRYRQTMSAILGVDAWITFVSFGLALVTLGIGSESFAEAVIWVQLLLFLWFLYISAWVLARSLSQPLIVGLMFEILYLLTILGISSMLLPAPSSTST